MPGNERYSACFVAPIFGLERKKRAFKTIKTMSLSSLFLLLAIQPMRTLNMAFLQRQAPLSVAMPGP